MAVRVLDQQNLSYFLGRIEKLSKDSPRKFGTMDVTKMMRHMRNAFETAMGETNLPDASKPFVGKFLYYVITHVITTWPGGRIKAPDYWTPPSDHSYEEERELFVVALKRSLRGSFATCSCGRCLAVGSPRSGLATPGRTEPRACCDRRAQFPFVTYPAGWAAGASRPTEGRSFSTRSASFRRRSR